VLLAIAISALPIEGHIYLFTTHMTRNKVIASVAVVVVLVIGLIAWLAATRRRAKDATFSTACSDVRQRLWPTPKSTTVGRSHALIRYAPTGPRQRVRVVTLGGRDRFVTTT
jgi:hypothetical protein